MEHGTIEKNNELNVGVRRFIFDTVISEEYTRQADITDQFVENNSTIQDHYALKPEELTIRGFVAEVTYQREDSQFLEEQKVGDIKEFIDVFAKIEGSYAIVAIKKNESKLKNKKICNLKYSISTPPKR